MKNQPTVSKTLDLPGGTLIPFASVPGERVRILFGRVWLTEEGSPDDVVLGRGDEVAFGTRGLAVIEALSPARIQLIEQTSISNTVLKAAQRWTRWLGILWLRQFRRPVAVHACQF